MSDFALEEFQPFMEDRCLNTFETMQKAQKFRAPFLDAVAEASGAIAHISLSAFDQLTSSYRKDEVFQTMIAKVQTHLTKQVLAPLEDAAKLAANLYARFTVTMEMAQQR